MYNIEIYSHRKCDRDWYMSVILFRGYCELGRTFNADRGIGSHWQTHYTRKVCQDMLNTDVYKFRSRFIWQ